MNMKIKLFSNSKSKKLIILFLFIFNLINCISADPKLLQVVSVGAKASKLSQYGITWYFKEPVEFGKYITGDYWVIGPVEIVYIDPPSLDINNRISNGSMINPSPKSILVQGYDSGMYDGYVDSDEAFSEDLNAARPNGNDLSDSNPLLLETGSSLVSTISFTDVHRPQLQHAAVLTVLEKSPAENSFRPPYAGSDKNSYYTLDSLDLSVLQNLPRAQFSDVLPRLNYDEDEVIDETAELDDTNTPVFRMFQRPWIDHTHSKWQGKYCTPFWNNPHYGREIALATGRGALMMNLDYTVEEKMPLIIGYAQAGIDYYQILLEKDGLSLPMTTEERQGWIGTGGHNHGKKLLIMVSGLLLGNDDMLNVGTFRTTGYWFALDDQLHYIETIDGGYTSADIGKPDWNDRQYSEDGRFYTNAWNEGYQAIVSPPAIGITLAAMIMGIYDEWDNKAVFDYADRWYQREKNNDSMMNAVSAFHKQMWDRYRSEYGYNEIQWD